MNYLKKFLAITLIFVMQFQSVHASVAVGGGWGLNLIRVENSTSIFTAFKDGFQSTVAISPSSAQVAKSLLRGGLVGLALSAVTQALLDGVDYVMDSAKQELRYKPIDKYTGGTSSNSNYCTNSNFSDCPTSTPYLYSSGTLSGVYFTTLDGACERFKSDMGYGPHSWYCLADYKERNLILYRKSDNLKDREFGWIKPNGGYSSSYDKTIPLTTLATQIINLAEQGNPDAKAYIASVVQDMLEHDEDYRKSLEAQLDAKLKEATQTKKPNDGCPPNAIRNKNGDCWICSEASRKPIKARVDKAKEQTNNLAGCKGNMSKSDLQLRFDAYSEFVSAREAENQCWLPPDEGHVRSANEMKITVKQCEKLIRRLSK
jgi:hypothetical protein